MNNNKFRIEHLIFFIAFLLALFLRLSNLGHFSLSDKEATLAVESLKFSKGLVSNFSESPLYILVTGFLFYVFKPNELMARIFPAVIGSCIVIFPLFLRKIINAKTAMILAFGLAIDPLLIAISRQLNGLQLTLVFFIFFLVFILDNRMILSGIFLGLIILTGRGFWQLILILLFSALLIWIFNRRGFNQIKSRISSISLNKMLLPALLTFLLIGTQFGRDYKALSAVFSSLGDYVQGWNGNYTASIVSFLAALFVYEFIPMIFTVYGAIISADKRSTIYSLLMFSVLSGLFIMLIYPERQMIDLAWVVILLWIVAAKQIGEFISLIKLQSNWLMVLGEALLVCVLCVFALINIASIPNGVYTTSDIQLRLTIFIVSIVMIVLIGLLVNWGWSKSISVNGILIGLVSIILCLSLFNTFHVSSLIKPANNEIYYIGNYVPEEDLLLSTIDDFSEWSVGNQEEIDIAVVNLDTPELNWILRDYKNVSFVNYIPADKTPSLIVSADKETPNLSVEYTGQDFSISKKQILTGYSFWDITSWFFYRDLRFESDDIVLWVRTDIFPGIEDNETVF